MTPNVIIKHFKILLHFDIESEIIDLLLHNIKLKICDRIGKYLAFTDNFEIRNIKDFFSEEEFQIVNLSEDNFIKIIAHSDKYISEIAITELNDEMSLEKNLTSRKREIINVDNIIISLFNEIKEYLFMLKVIEKTIHLKLKNLKTKRELEFLTIVKEIYFTLFHILGNSFFLKMIVLKNFRKIILKVVRNFWGKLLKRKIIVNYFHFTLIKRKMHSFQRKF